MQESKGDDTTDMPTDKSAEQEVFPTLLVELFDDYMGIVYSDDPMTPGERPYLDLLQCWHAAVEIIFRQMTHDNPEHVVLFKEQIASDIKMFKKGMDKRHVRQVVAKAFRDKKETGE